MTNKGNFEPKNVLLLSGAIISIMFMISSYVWTQIPAGEQVCIHWNAAGVCDNYGNKFVGIYLMPLIALALVGLLTLIPLIDPRSANIAKSRKAYSAAWTVILLFFLALHSVLMLDILGLGVNIGTVVPFLVGLIFLVIGNYMGKVRSNYFFGIRTPWTLSSELSWNKTHRLGGKLFMLLGLAFMAIAFLLTGEVWIYLLLVGVIAMVIILMAYSYLVWKNDTTNRVQDSHT